MNTPTVKVKEIEYSVDRISVVLKVNSGTLIHLRLSEKLDGTEHKLSNEEAFKQEFFQDICQEAEGIFQWGGTTLKFILVGSNSLEGITFELVGLVVKKDLIEWFNQNNFKDNKQDYLIYQKTQGKNSWDFLEKVIGNKFQKPNQDFIEKLKLLFPENGCIWRYRDSNNFHFLNRAIAFASRHLPEVQGWCAFDADKPLRLILFEEKKQDATIPELDRTWNTFDLFLPNRYSWNRWLDRSCTLSRDLDIKPGQEIALIEQLVNHGSNEDEKGLDFQAQNPTRLLFVPGTINMGDKNIFCHTVSYEFKLPAFDAESPSVTMKIELDYPERQIGDNEVVSLRLPGKFKAWEKETEEETQVKIAPSDEFNNWGIVDEKNQSVKSGGDAVLFTQILSPTYSDKKYSGIYIKHEKDDEMIVDVHPCGVPLVLGSMQKYRKELEEADVTLSGKKINLSAKQTEIKSQVNISSPINDLTPLIKKKKRNREEESEKSPPKKKQRNNTNSAETKSGGESENFNLKGLKVPKGDDDNKPYSSDSFKRPSGWYEGTLDKLFAKSVKNGRIEQIELRGQTITMVQCDATGRFGDISDMDIGHKEPWQDYVASKKPQTKREAINAYNDLDNLRLEKPTANRSHDFELGRESEAEDKLDEEMNDFIVPDEGMPTEVRKGLDDWKQNQTRNYP